MITRAAIAKQLIPGLKAVVGMNYGKVDNEHTPLFEIDSSSRSFEEEQMMSGFAGAFTKSEGGAVQYDDVAETYTSRYTHETLALAFAITEEAWEDNLYESKSKMRAAALGRAMAATKQTKAANLFNLGFSATQLGGDGVALFSASHPTISGTNQSNTVSADMSESTLETALIAVSLFKDERGVLINAMAKSLHIPPQLQFTAFKILKSDLSTTPITQGGNNVSNTNETNALRAQGFFPGGTHINRRFTDTDAWFIRTDQTDGTKMFVRAKLAFSSEGDFDTGNIRYKARERYSFGWTDWRAWYGSAGA